MFITTKELQESLTNEKRDYQVELLENILFELRLVRVALNRRFDGE